MMGAIVNRAVDQWRTTRDDALFGAVLQRLEKRRRVVSRAMRQVAEALGDTPAVGRASYVDPRVIAHYEKGGEFTTGSEREVRDLLRQT